jgi:vitamin B12 transporter
MTLRSFILLLLIATLPAAAGAAQAPADTGKPARDSLAAYRLSPVIVTGTAVPVRAAVAGFGLTVLSAADLARKPGLYAADAMRELPGATIDEAAGPGGPTIIRLRGGEEVFTQILFDGVRVNQNGGFFDMQGLTLTNVERVEIARGPQSGLYGSSAVSGVVQFITPQGQVGPARYELSTEAGTAERYGGAFRSAITTSGGTEHLRYSAGTGVTYARGLFAAPHDTWTRDGSLRLDALPADAWHLTGNVRFANVDAHLPVRDPGATRVPLDSNARNSRDRVLTSLEARYEPNRRVTHRLNTAHYREYFVYEDQYDAVAESTSYPFFVFDANFLLKSQLDRTTFGYDGSVQLGDLDRPRPYRLAYGALWEHEGLTDRQRGDYGDSDISFDRPNAALYLEAHAPLTARLNTLVGARLDKYEGLPAELSPRASATFELVPGIAALRAAGGRAYKAPNLQQQYAESPFIRGNPDLRPETSTSWEVGAELRGAGGVLTVTYFRSAAGLSVERSAQRSLRARGRGVLLAVGAHRVRRRIVCCGHRSPSALRPSRAVAPSRTAAAVRSRNAGPAMSAQVARGAATERPSPARGVGSLPDGVAVDER